MSRYINLLFIPILLWCATCYAAPSISSLTLKSGDTYTTGAELSISGANYGSKSPAIPWIYDNFENGKIGEDLTTSELSTGAWTFFNLGDDTVNTTYSNDFNPANSTKVAKFSWEDTDDANGGQTVCGLNVPSDMNTDEMYIFYKRYFIPSSEPVESSNIKQYYEWGDNSNDPQSILAIPSGSSGWTISHNGTGFGSGSSINNNYSTATFDNSRDAWQTWQTYYKLNTTYEVPYDGIVWATFDGNVEIDSTTYGSRTEDLSASNFTYVRLGNMYQMNESDGGTDDGFAFAYLDDVYVDKTRARVMLGNNSTFTACTQLEIQIPRKWSATDIVIDFKQGRFTSGQTGYLFVVDPSGLVNTGYEIEIGETGTQPEAPTPPGGNAKIKIIGSFKWYGSFHIG